MREEPHPRPGGLRGHGVVALGADDRCARLHLPHRFPCLPTAEIRKVRENGSPTRVYSPKRHRPPSWSTLSPSVQVTTDSRHRQSRADSRSGARTGRQLADSGSGKRTVHPAAPDAAAGQQGPAPREFDAAGGEGSHRCRGRQARSRQGGRTWGDEGAASAYGGQCLVEPGRSRLGPGSRWSRQIRSSATP